VLFSKLLLLSLFNNLIKHDCNFLSRSNQSDYEVKYYFIIYSLILFLGTSKEIKPRGTDKKKMESLVFFPGENNII